MRKDHLADLRKSGLSDLTIKQAGIRTVTLKEISAKLGRLPAGIESAYEIPFDNSYSRFRVFYTGEEAKGKKRPKYLSRKNSGNRLYIPEKIKEILNDSATPLFITEGEKKALKASQSGIFCIAVSGLWNWKLKNENKLISDFDKISLEEREIYLVPDNNFLDVDRFGREKNLKQACYDLAYLLIDRGSKVFLVELPKNEKKIGLDDFLLEHTAKDFDSLPKHEIKKLSLSQEIEKLKKGEPYTGEARVLVKRIAELKSDLARASYIAALSKRTGWPKLSIRKEIKSFSESNTNKDIESGNYKIVHPSYDVSEGLIVLGFKETIVTNKQPQDRNFYILGKKGKLYLATENSFKFGDDIEIFFDTRERILIDVNDRWSKGHVCEFISRPTRPLGVYGEVKDLLKKYVEYQTDSHYGLISAWIIATYFHRCFNAFPFLFFLGRKGCGKSRSLDILERLSFGANKIQGVSVASLADTVDGIRGAFLFDQAESLSNPKNEEILGIITDSYTVGGGKRRIVHISNKTRKVLEFETYAPKAFASIKEAHYDLRDRCIIFAMPKALADFPYPEKHLPVWGEMRNKLYRLLLTCWAEVRSIYNRNGFEMKQRTGELWKPIKTILTLENVPADEQAGIMNLFSDAMEESQSGLSEKEYELFHVLLNVLLKDRTAGEITVNDIADMFDTGQFTNERSKNVWVGKTLRQFGLYTKEAPRQNKKRAYVFSYEHVKDVFRRFAHNNEFGSFFNNCQDNKSSGVKESKQLMLGLEKPTDANAFSKNNYKRFTV